MFASRHDLTMTIIEKFFSLLRIAVGGDVSSKLELSYNDWDVIYNLATEQSVLGIVL